MRIPTITSSGLRVRPTLTLLITLTLTLTCLHEAQARRRRSRPKEASSSSSSPGRCELIQVPMCKNMVDYNTTKLPNKFGHSTQSQVYWAMQRWWPFLDAGCSNNLRNYLCGLYLPKCVGSNVKPQYPCLETCRKAKSRCKRQMRRQGYRWNKHFKCKKLLPRSSNKCIKPQREMRKGKNREYILCEVNQLSMCQGIPFSQGSLPNMFLQSDLSMIEREMSQYKELVASGCSNKLRMFLCGVFMPFCVQGRHHREEEQDDRGAAQSRGHSTHFTPQHDVPFLLPCREWCQEVHDQCSGEFQQRTHGLPWPGKFHCSRFPSYRDQYGYHTGNGSAGHAPTIPCTMPPVNFENN